jgi:hypothetical protein
LDNKRGIKYKDEVPREEAKDVDGKNEEAENLRKENKREKIHFDE